MEETAKERPRQNWSRLSPVSRCSFAISDRDAFNKAIALSVAWIARTANVRLPESAYEHQDFDLQTSERASGSGTRLDDDMGSVWAAKIEYHADRTAPRRWITDLFVEQRKGSFVRLGAQLSCAYMPSDPGFEHSRPRVIRDALSELAAEADGESLTNTFQSVTVDDVGHLAGLLYASDRRLPVVAISVDDDGGAQVDLQSLANRLSGAAHLRCLATETSFELSRTVGKRMSVYNGAVRIYMPGLDQEQENPFSHPLWLPPYSGYNPRLLREIASRVLPVGFQDSDGDARFWRVGLLRSVASRAAANVPAVSQQVQVEAELSALKAELDVARENEQTAESLMFEAASSLADAQANVQQLQEENFSLRERMRYSSSTSSELSTSLTPDDVHAVAEQDSPLEGSLRVISALFPDRITILQSAYDSARDSFAFRHRKRAFELLWTLATGYWSALADGESDATARQCFGAAYAAKEAETISRAGRKRRTFLVNGIEMEMERHLKIGIADNKIETLRVHFEWMNQERRIVIGHCGGHLDF